MFEGYVPALRDGEEDGVGGSAVWGREGEGEGVGRGREVSAKMVRELEDALAVRSEKRERLREERRKKRQERRRETDRVVSERDRNLELEQESQVLAKEDEVGVKDLKEVQVQYESEASKLPLAATPEDNVSPSSNLLLSCSSSISSPLDCEHPSTDLALPSLTSQLALTVASIAANRKRAAAVPTEETFGSEEDSSQSESDG